MLTPWGIYQSACIHNHELTFHILKVQVHVATSVSKSHRGIAPKVLFILSGTGTQCFTPWTVKLEELSIAIYMYLN